MKVDVKFLLCVYKELEVIIGKFVWGLIFTFKLFLDKT